MFQPLAAQYERTNRVLTFGLDRVWRRYAVERVFREPVRSVLDLGTGTGEVALALARRGGEAVSVTAVDISDAMLDVARTRPGADRVRWVAALAANLPFEDASFDAAIVAFAVRNLAITPEHFRSSLREIARVVRPGGRLIMLETTQPPSRVVRALLHLYARWVVPTVGAWLTGHGGPYRYLGSSICAFDNAAILARHLLQAGFSSASFEYLALGLVAIHEAVRET